MIYTFQFTICWGYFLLFLFFQAFLSLLSVSSHAFTLLFSQVSLSQRICNLVLFVLFCAPSHCLLLYGLDTSFSFRVPILNTLHVAISSCTISICVSSFSAVYSRSYSSYFTTLFSLLLHPYSSRFIFRWAASGCLLPLSCS